MDENVVTFGTSFNQPWCLYVRYAYLFPFTFKLIVPGILLVDVERSEDSKVRQSRRSISTVNLNLSTNTKPVHVTQTTRNPYTSIKILVFPSPVPHTHLYITRPSYATEISLSTPLRFMLQSSRVKWKEYEAISNDKLWRLSYEYFEFGSRHKRPAKILEGKCEIISATRCLL